MYLFLCVNIFCLKTLDFKLLLLLYHFYSCYFYVFNYVRCNINNICKGSVCMKVNAFEITLVNRR